MLNINELIDKYRYKGRGVFEPAIKIEHFLIEIIRGKGRHKATGLIRVAGLPKVN